MASRDSAALPFPITAGFSTLALNGAKGGCTKYLTLQYLNYARWTSQQHSCGITQALRIMARTHLVSADGRWNPRGFLQFWNPSVTLVNETVHWAMKVPLAIGLYGVFLDAGLASGLILGFVPGLSSAGEAEMGVALTGWSERFGVHMGSVRNFAWNFSFFEWKRYLHNAVDKTPQGAPTWFCAHLDWLRSLDKKNQANFLTFEAATLGTYLTFFNMAGDNIKTKMQYDPVQYPSFTGTVKQIWSQHGLVGFARGSLFKGIYLILGASSLFGI
ncbi:unnamed protein product [Polarella glacialis]|uniref:Uncharacterized protein n=1 Tax=Polarella glacialis TaxID=89957 RepID=A0A813DS00_POLGL|nr:unnamed protein product [Polarella glacialis]